MMRETPKLPIGKRESVWSERCDATRCLSVIVTALSCVFICLTFPCTLPFCFKRLEQWERIVVFRLGRLRGVFGPGLVFIIPWSDRLNRVDMRTKAFSVPPQQVITCDNGIVELGCDVKYRVSDVKRLTTTVTTPEHGLRNFGKTVLLNVVTKHTVKEMERDRAGLASQVQRDLNSRVLEWGIEIGQVDLSQVTILKEPEPNDPLKPLLGALGSFAGGGASSASGSAGGALGAMGAGDTFKGASALLSGLLSGGVTQPATHTKGGTTFVNIPGLAGSPAADCTPSMTSNDRKQQMQVDAGSDTEPLLPHCDSFQGLSNCTDKPRTPLGQYLLSLVTAANSTDLTAGVYRLAVERPETEGTAIFVVFVGSGVRHVIEGDLPSVTPDVSVSVTQDDLYSIFSGTLPPLQAYLSGRLSVQGSVQMLVGLQALQEVHQSLYTQNKNEAFVA
ncbi:SCP2 sterol-binding domain [Trinorchestia longiramus]|nr:SCP2 sterol-binding domain [Trinorchestia longiramus]